MDVAEQRDFEGLMKENENLVRQVCFNYEKDSGLLEDLTQEVWLRAYEKFDQFEGNSDVSSWFYAVAESVGRNWVRRNDSRPSLVYLSDLEERPSSGMGGEDDDETSDAVGLLDSLIDSNGSPEDWAVAESIADQIESQKDVTKLTWIVLHFLTLEAMSVPEIAKELQMEETTVRTYLHRVREYIQRILEEGK